MFVALNEDVAAHGVDAFDHACTDAAMSRKLAVDEGLVITAFEEAGARSCG